MWQYMVLFRCVEDPSTVNMDIWEGPYIEGPREEAALQICDKLDIPRELFVACVEVSPTATARISNDGAMLRVMANNPATLPKAELKDQRKVA